MSAARPRTANTVLAAVRLVWAASRRNFLLVTVLQTAQGAGLLGLLLAVGTLLREVLGARTFAGALPAVLLLVTLQALVGVTGAVMSGRDQVLSELVGRHVQRQVLGVAADLDYPAFETPELHDRLERAATRSVSGPIQVVYGLIPLLGAAFAVTGATVALLVVQPLLVPLVLLAAVPAIVAAARGGRAYAGFVTELTESERERRYLGSLLTARPAAKEVRALRLADHLLGRWERLADHRLDALRTVVRRQLVLDSAGALASAALLGGALLVLVALLSAGRLTAAEAGTAGVALLLLGQRIRSIGISVGMLAESAPFVRDLQELLAAGRTARRDRPGAPAPAGFDRITVEGVSFTHPSSRTPAVREVSLSLAAGEVVALVGENGSGKTTLATLLCGLHRPQSGTIRWDGVDLATVDPAGVRDRVAVLFQDFQRFLLPARDNVGFGRVDRLSDLPGIRRAAADAGADDLLAGLPDGYDTVLGPEFSGGTDLSGGQWQRVGLARAFFRDAPLVILDEPTAALDPRAERALYDAVRRLFQGRTVLLITHRFTSVRSADRIVVLHDGAVVETGTHADLIGADGRYAELYRLQAQLYDV